MQGINAVTCTIQGDSRSSSRHLHHSSEQACMAVAQGMHVQKAQPPSLSSHYQQTALPHPNSSEWLGRLQSRQRLQALDVVKI